MTSTHTEIVRQYFNRVAPGREKWQKRARYYHNAIINFFKFLIPEGSSIVEIGCGLGDLLVALKPKRGLGIDISDEIVSRARARHPGLEFMAADAQDLKIQEQFDYVILPDVIGNLEDVQKCFESLHRVANQHSRVIVTSYNHGWEWILKLLEWLHLKMPQPNQNWLSGHDIENLFSLAGFEVIKRGSIILLPLYIPIISTILNRYIARLPLIRRLCLSNYFIARPKAISGADKEYSVSVIVPARNEAGNIESIVKRLPKLGSSTELIFVEGGSQDNTAESIKKIIEEYTGKREIIYIDQENGKGKGDAVRRGFARATGDILMILDADMTVRPEDLPKFYNALRIRQGEFIMGSRLVYPMENGAMRFLNMIGNKFFSVAFSWLLDQPIKDTLCGTKVLFRSDYEAIARGRSYFGNFDPFGDFDLIFGAAKLNLKIVEIPIRYQARIYGTTNISRFKHGWLLLKMTLFAAKKIKFR